MVKQFFSDSIDRFSLEFSENWTGVGLSHVTAQFVILQGKKKRYLLKKNESIKIAIGYVLNIKRSKNFSSHYRGAFCLMSTTSHRENRVKNSTSTKCLENSRGQRPSHEVRMLRPTRVSYQRF